MARLIQKSGYIKNGKASGYMEYVATRDGVEIIQSTEPATKKQKQFIKRLLKDFPDAKELFEYSDYLQTPNRGTASAFIAVALDTHLHEVESESGYMSYIAQRPRAENTVAMACSARRTPPTSRRRRPSWKLTTEKCGRLFSLCGGKTQNVWDTTKPLRGGIC